MNLTEYKKQVFDKITQLEARIYMLECRNKSLTELLYEKNENISMLESDVNKFYGWFVDIKKKLEEQCKTTHSES